MTYKPHEISVLHPSKELVCPEQIFAPLSAREKEQLYKRFDQLQANKEKENEK